MRKIKLISKVIIFLGMFIASAPKLSQYLPQEYIQALPDLDYSCLEPNRLYQIVFSQEGSRKYNTSIGLPPYTVSIDTNFSGFIAWFIVWIEEDQYGVKKAFVYDHYSADDKSHFICQPTDGKSELDRDYIMVFSTVLNKNINGNSCIIGSKSAKNNNAFVSAKYHTDTQSAQIGLSAKIKKKDLSILQKDDDFDTLPDTPRTQCIETDSIADHKSDSDDENCIPAKIDTDLNPSKQDEKTYDSTDKQTNDPK